MYKPGKNSSVVQNIKAANDSGLSCFGRILLLLGFLSIQSFVLSNTIIRAQIVDVTFTDMDSIVKNEIDTLIVEKEKANNEIDVYMNQFETFEYLNGDLIIENSKSYSAANSRVSLLIGGKETQGYFQYSGNIGSQLELSDYKIKVIGLQKSENNTYILHLKLIIKNPEKIDNSSPKNKKKKFLKFKN